MLRICQPCNNTLLDQSLVILLCPIIRIHQLSLDLTGAAQPMERRHGLIVPARLGVRLVRDLLERRRPHGEPVAAEDLDAVVQRRVHHGVIHVDPGRRRIEVRDAERRVARRRAARGIDGFGGRCGRDGAELGLQEREEVLRGLEVAGRARHVRLRRVLARRRERARGVRHRPARDRVSALSPTKEHNIGPGTHRKRSSAALPFKGLCSFLPWCPPGCGNARASASHASAAASTSRLNSRPRYATQIYASAHTARGRTSARRRRVLVGAAGGGACTGAGTAPFSSKWCLLSIAVAVLQEDMGVAGRVSSGWAVESGVYIHGA